MRKTTKLIVIMCIMCIGMTLFASAWAYYSPRINFERLYQKFAAELEEKNETIDAMIMTDLNRDNVPELFTLTKCGNEEWNKQKLLVERAFYVNISPYRFSGGVSGLPVDDMILESSPWRDENDTIKTGITMKKLPGEYYEYPGETFVLFRADINESNRTYLSTYDVGGAINDGTMYEIWLNEKKDDQGIANGYEFVVDSEEYTDKYTEKYIGSTAPYACIRLLDLESGERMTVTDAVNTLLSDFVAADKKTINASDWAKEEIYEARRFDIVEKNMYQWDMTENITREEFAAIVVNMLKIRSSAVVYTADVSDDIVDISDSPYKSAIEYAYKMGIIKGTSVDETTGKVTFSPKEKITREQMATIIYRSKCVNLSDVDWSFESFVAQNIVFVDFDKISDYAKEPMLALRRVGIMFGTEVKNNGIRYVDLNAGGFTTREQAIAVILRLLKARSDDFYYFQNFREYLKIISIIKNYIKNTYQRFRNIIQTVRSVSL